MSIPLQHSVDFYFADFGSAVNYYGVANQVVAWLNRCFDKNTNRLFIPGKVLRKVTEVPSFGSAYRTPARGFRFHLYLVPFSPNNTQLMPNGDHAVVVGANAAQLQPPGMDRGLLNTILHEFGHGFGVAIGEYYGIRVLKDFTLHPPELRVSALRPDDYWSRPLRASWLRDVMLVPNAFDPTWSPLSALVIRSGQWRASGPPCPDLSAIRVASEFPEFKRACVEAYRMHETYPAWSGQTDANGYFTLDWRAESAGTAVSSDQFRKLIFRSPDSSNPMVVLARGLSIFDVQLAWLEACATAGPRATADPAIPFTVCL